jgi:glycerophosphoryl diester phosphodiesterase
MRRNRDVIELICTILFVVGCHAVKPLTMNLPAFDKEGHRGSRGLMPENTIPAMLKGLELGVTTLEMDAVITRDKKVILSHEPFFNHEITTLPGGGYISPGEERNYNIFKMDFGETQRYDVGLKPHPRFPQQQKIAATKPLLSEVIDQSEKYALQNGRPAPFYNIETKTQPATDQVYHPAPEEFVSILMTVILNKKVEDRVIIQSFDPRTLQIIHRKYPFMKTALLIEDFDHRSLEEQLGSLGFTPSIYSPAYSLVNTGLLESCHQRKMKCIPWTVDDPAEIKRLRDLGVDGIITDYPNYF